MPTHSVASAAAIIGISPSQIRNWCTQFAPSLSDGANPGPGQPRWLTSNDVAILQRVKELRAAGVDYAAIAAQLPDPADLPAPYIDVRVETLPVAGAPNALESTIDTQKVITYVESRLDALQADLLRLQLAQETSDKKQVGQISTLGIGIVIGALLVVAVWAVFALASYVGG